MREHASFDNRMMLSHFMVQLVELIAEFYDQHGFLMKDVSLCNVGLRSLQERTVLLLRVAGRGAWKTGRGGVNRGPIWCQSLVPDFGARTWCQNLVPEFGARIWCQNLAILRASGAVKFFE